MYSAIALQIPAFMSPRQAEGDVGFGDIHLFSNGRHRLDEMYLWSLSRGEEGGLEHHLGLHGTLEKIYK